MAAGGTNFLNALIGKEASTPRRSSSNSNCQVRLLQNPRRNIGASREKNLFSDATIMKFVARDETQFHREFPFSWRRNDRSVVEGLIDALMIDRAGGRCLLLDWKTNDVSTSEVESFRARYRPQLTAYWKAVSEITRLEVEAGLFSTALGRLLLYSPDELKSEWSRLEQLPPTDLSEEIRPDDF